LPRARRRFQHQRVRSAKMIEDLGNQGIDRKPQAAIVAYQLREALFETIYYPSDRTRCSTPHRALAEGMAYPRPAGALRRYQLHRPHQLFPSRRRIFKVSCTLPTRKWARYNPPFFATYAFSQLSFGAGWFVGRFHVGWVLAIGFFLLERGHRSPPAPPHVRHDFRAASFCLGSEKAFLIPPTPRILAANIRSITAASPTR